MLFKPAPMHDIINSLTGVDQLDRKLNILIVLGVLIVLLQIVAIFKKDK